MASRSIYPTLEDMSVGRMIAAEQQQRITAQSQQPMPSQSTVHYASSTGSVYPSLGLAPVIYASPPNQVMVPSGTTSARPSNLQLVAPLTGSSLGAVKAHVHHGIRPVTLCKDQDGKAGLRLLSYDSGIFVTFVVAGSPASLSGIRFGDQVLQINDINCAGWTTDKAMDMLKDANGQTVVLAVRDRPFERTITMLKDSTNRAGFGFKNGVIEKIVQDSSAARNGILTDHQLLEVNGQNVIGLNDKEISRILDNCARDVTVTVMSTKVFQQFMKGTNTSFIRKSMDHA